MMVEATDPTPVKSEIDKALNLFIAENDRTNQLHED